MFQADAACDFRVERITHAVERVTGPAWRVDGRTDASTHYLSYCLAGSADYRIEGGAFPVRQGDVLLLPADTRRSATCDPDAPWRFYSLGFTLAFSRPGDAESFRALPPVLRAPTLRPLFEDVLSVWQGRRTAYILGTRGMMEQLLYEIIRLVSAAEHNPYHYACIERVVRRMQADFTHTYDAVTLAREAGFSTAYFRTLFKRITGRSVVQYQNYVRVSRAKDLLRSGAANVTEASYLTGFHDIYYFSRLFKRVTGHAPSHYLDKGETQYGSKHSV